MCAASNRNTRRRARASRPTQPKRPEPLGAPYDPGVRGLPEPRDRGYVRRKLLPELLDPLELVVAQSRSRQGFSAMGERPKAFAREGDLVAVAVQRQKHVCCLLEQAGIE